MPITNEPSLPATPPSADALPVGDASLHLEQRLVSRWDDLLGALHSGNFYIELLLIFFAIMLAGIIGAYISRKIRNRLAVSPPKFIDAVFLTNPLLLLAPTLAVLFLGVVKGFVTELEVGGGLTSGVIELAYAYWLTKCVMLVVQQRPVAYLISGVIIINAALRAARVSRVVSAFLESVAFDVGEYHFTALHLLNGLIIFVVMFWGAGLLSRALESYLRRSSRLSLTTLHLTVKFFRIFAYVIAAVITMSAMGIDLTAFAIFTGALGVGIGLGLQKLTANFFSGVTVMMERSIKIGDLIEVGGQTGWVRQLNMRYALLETFDGREVLIPNEELISSRVVNWTLTTTHARIEIKVTVTFDSDAEKTKDLLMEAALEHPRCLRDPAPSCYLREFADHGIGFALSFWISDIKEGRNGPQSDVMFLILKKFSQNGITLAHA